jgi:hypothetical protein
MNMLAWLVYPKRKRSKSQVAIWTLLWFCDVVCNFYLLDNGEDEECGNVEKSLKNNTSMRTRPLNSSSLANAIPQRTETFDEGRVSDLSLFLVYCAGCSTTFCSSRSHRHPFGHSERNADPRHDIEYIRISSLWCIVVSNHIRWQEIDCRMRASFFRQSTAYVSFMFKCTTLAYLTCTRFVCLFVYRHRAQWFSSVLIDTIITHKNRCSAYIEPWKLLSTKHALLRQPISALDASKCESSITLSALPSHTIAIDWHRKNTYSSIRAQFRAMPDFIDF